MLEFDEITIGDIKAEPNGNGFYFETIQDGNTVKHSHTFYKDAEIERNKEIFKVCRAEHLKIWGNESASRPISLPNCK